jgi:hypothetical protein
MPSPKTTRTRCTGCLKIYLTSRQLATRKTHFHNRACKTRHQRGKARSDRGRKNVWRTCGFCGNGFLAGGRDKSGKRLPNKKQRYCDRVCAGRAKLNHGMSCANLEPQFAEWASGYFDGEGSAFLLTGNGRGRHCPIVTIGSTDRKVLDDLARNTGVGTVTRRRATSTRHRELYMWRCFSQAALSFLQQIHSHLIIKRPVADFVLQSCRQMDTHPRLAYLPKWRTAVVKRIRELNQRGSAGVAIRLAASPTAIEKSYRRLQQEDVYLPCNLPFTRQSTFYEQVPHKPSHWRRHPKTRICPVCEKEYSPRTTPTPKNPGSTCSAACSCLFRRRQGKPCLVIHPVLCAHFAGIVDAEACVSIARSGGTIHARIDFGNTNKLAVQLMKDMTGIGSLNERLSKKANHATSWHWRSQADGAEGFLEQIFPHLRTKRRQAELALYVQDRLRDPTSRRNRGWHEEAIAASKTLNQKGQASIPDRISLADGRIQI